MTSYKIILIFSIITSCDARPLIDPRQYSENRKGDVIYCFVWGFIAAENSREPSWVHGTYPFHAANGMLNKDTDLTQGCIGSLLIIAQLRVGILFTLARLLCRDCNPIAPRVRLNTKIA